MKVGILAVGLGTRLSEETVIKPKPMVEIGGEPILWHIMKIYSSFGFNEFVIVLGYKGEVIQDYFVNFHYWMHNLTIDIKKIKLVFMMVMMIHGLFTCSILAPQLIPGDG